MAKPIFCLTHPRACSTAFERVFMTRTHDLTCVHEPFGDAYYFGPERMGSRYESDPNARSESGFDNYTYQTILDRLEDDGNEGKRLFLKDMSQYLVPPNGKPAQIAPSLDSKRRGIGTTTSVHDPIGSLKQASPPFPYGTQTEPGNPTIVPEEILRKFHFTFLIRDPHNSIPSYYRCTIPPLDKVTGWNEFYPEEAGYDEVRRMFDYLVTSGQVGPNRAGLHANGVNGHANGVNGHVNGVNGHTNGVNSHTNGVNGYTNGVNGYTNGINGHTNGINGHTNGINGHTNGINGHTNGTNGYTNGTNRYTANGEHANGSSNVDICLVDADDLLDNPEGIIKEYCRSVGLDYSPRMLNWDSDEAHERAKDAFEKWKGFHDDAIESRDLKPRPAHKKKIRTEEEWDAEWLNKYGEKGAKLIRETVNANMSDYLYLKQFAMKV